MFLQCYQLILWKQCWSLIHEKKLPSELEVVVHDLWALRLQLLVDEFGIISHHDGEASVYSSQIESAEHEGSTLERGMGVKGEKLPMLVESLGLCYLGMVLLRIPVNLGDLQR